ncbi:MAG TPA: DUF1232 domain-containing protein [Longimicrobium sp.]|jgi:uncharacterized membrane protein YkvA (DUF1232 family)
MADRNDSSRRRFSSDDDDMGSAGDAPRRRSVLDDDDDLVGPRTVAPRPRRGGKGGGAPDRGEMMMSLLRDLPNFGRLVVRLARDPRVSMLDKGLVVAALAYAAVPADAIPDVIPFLGELDDVVVVGVALARLVNNAGIELMLEHWEGDQGTLEAALDVVERSSNLLPAPLKGILLGSH